MMDIQGGKMVNQTYSEDGLYFSKSLITSEQSDVLLAFAEQGLVIENEDNFFIDWDTVITLSSDVKQFLELPEKFLGKIYINFKSLTYSDNFKVIWGFYKDKKEVYPVITGATMQIGTQYFLMDKPLYQAVKAIRKHESLLSKSEEDNLYLIYSLKEASDNGLKIDLHQFNNFEFVVPEKVSLYIECDENGNLLLTPNFGISESPSEIRKRLHQIHKNIKGTSIRNKNTIVILNDKNRKAVEEVIKARKINKSEREKFLNNPSSYIDDNLVDLENGFSARVIGVTEFTQAYFGDQEKQNNNWYETSGEAKTNIVHKMPYVRDIIKSEEDLNKFIQICEDAVQNNAETIRFKDNLFSIENPQEIEDIIAECKKKFALNEVERVQTLQKLVLDIKKNDTLLEYQNDFIDYKNLYLGEIDESAYLRKFYDYQNVGIRWILGHGLLTLAGEKQGCLLADDMGLGKSFMTLVAIREYQLHYKAQNHENRPVLVVAPVSLLENWKEEISKSYKNNFFDNIVLLTSSADLEKYKKSDVTKELTYMQDDENIGLTDVRYALKIGANYGKDRLDLPNNIILTNYETLRSYQASFALVDWSFVVFDEIQYIKNPNTRASIAAKALKANFKLAVTGTPVENSLKDIWNIFDIVDSGLLYEYQKFREEFIAPILSADLQTKYNVGQKLRQKIGYSMLRRDKESCLPGLTKKYIYSGCDNINKNVIFNPELSLCMSEKQEQLYVSVLEEYQNSLDKKSLALSTLKKLSLISLHPDLVASSNDDNLSITEDDIARLLKGSSKLSYLVRQLNEIQKRKEKVIVFVISKRLQELLRKVLGFLYNLNIRIINGDTKTTNSTKANPSRSRIIKEFSAVEGFNVIIMSPLAAGVGLTVTAANNVIHLERHWNPAKEAQATDRVYRIGQERDVNIYIPICKYSRGKSFDEILDALLSRKIDLNKSIVTPSEFSEEEIAQVTQMCLN